jgi:hypothetical protein
MDGHSKRGKFLKRAGLVILMGACAMLLSATQASATELDHFDDGGISLTVTSVTPTDSVFQTSLANVGLGGARLARLDFVSGSLSGTAVTLIDVDCVTHALSFSNDATTTSKLTLRYGDTDNDGDGDADADVTGCDEFFLNMTTNDLGTTIDWYVTDTDGIVDVSSQVVASPSGVIFPFSDFNLVDLSSVAMIEVVVNGVVNGDYVIDALECRTTIPEPLTMLGMFLGLGGVGAYIRKRRMA